MKTVEEFKAAIQAIDDKANLEKKEIARQYAFSKAKYKEGDIIQGRTTIIKVEKLKWGYGYSEPYIVYYGTQLKKDLTPTKLQKDCSIVDSNVISKLS